MHSILQQQRDNSAMLSSPDNVTQGALQSRKHLKIKRTASSLLYNKNHFCGAAPPREAMRTVNPEF